MPTPMPLTAFTLRGQRCVPLGRGLIVRDDQMLGFCSMWHKPQEEQPEGAYPDVMWYTIEQVAERAQVPRETVVARLRAKWGRADIIKPMGWERVVEARRNGITHDGKSMPVERWASYCRITQVGLEYRLAQGWPLEDVLRRAPTVKARIPIEEGVCPVGVRTAPDTSRGGFSGAFYFDGAVDNLEGHCRAKGLKYHTVRYRLKHGSTLWEALTVKRKPRTDAGKPNYKRSPKHWGEARLQPASADAGADAPPLDPLALRLDIC